MESERKCALLLLAVLFISLAFVGTLYINYKLNKLVESTVNETIATVNRVNTSVKIYCNGRIVKPDLALSTPIVVQYTIPKNVSNITVLFAGKPPSMLYVKCADGTTYSFSITGSRVELLTSYNLTCPAVLFTLNTTIVVIRPPFYGIFPYALVPP